MSAPDAGLIQLCHGNGGRLMRWLIEEVIVPALANPMLDTQLDAAMLPAFTGLPVITTDGFTVQPLEFPGGDIGSLAVHGTINDLAVAGAEPLYLALNLFIEEGFEISRLGRLMVSLGQAAKLAGVMVVAGDTKVLPRGQCGGLYLATTGVGTRTFTTPLGMNYSRPGDKVLVSGAIGDHGTAVMLAREQFGLSGSLLSDSASVLPLTRALQGLPGVRFMRDPTRGGLATVAHEVCQATGLGITLWQDAIPVSDQVQGVCELLGYDPYYLACEGRVMAIVSATDAPAALERWRGLSAGSGAAIVGEIQSTHSRVVLRTDYGGERILEELEDDPLPRIC
ncbi:hydrogenase expression/formation protein HypE [Marinobacter sp.]|uniref:hydrogenase expression/formation protein HypE n=1 Tax=Marinobacter sp. TaxID=50741 RepID=UPI0038510202